MPSPLRPLHKPLPRFLTRSLALSSILFYPSPKLSVSRLQSRSPSLRVPLRLGGGVKAMVDGEGEKAGGGRKGRKMEVVVGYIGT
eukprot:1393694-Amorphochlora_amoeboformis.AAC.1